MEVTLAELERTVAVEIDRAGIRQGNGQVSRSPDRRTLRYYTTIGLIDRPLAIRNRQAVYGERHVLQAVAIKRLQADGLSLGEIQTRLTGLPTAQLATIAGGAAPAGPDPAPRHRPANRWWATPAAAVDLAWPAAAAARVDADPAPATWAPPTGGPPDDSPVTLTGVPLGGGATLLVPADRPLSTDDVAAVRDAATPLITHLAEAGLTHSKDRP